MPVLCPYTINSKETTLETGRAPSNDILSRATISLVTLRRSQDDNKFGFRMEAIDGGVYIWFILELSPAQDAGLRFGDQVLAINGLPLAGHSSQEVIQICESLEKMQLTIRSREYYERKFVLGRNSKGSFGFSHSFGKIVSIERNSPAASQGLPIKHNILRIDDQTVVGLDETEIFEMIRKCGMEMRITILPGLPFGQLLRLAYVSSKIPNQVARAYKMYE